MPITLGRLTCAAVVLGTAAVVPLTAGAQTKRDVDRVMERLDHEPSVAETTRKALRYFRVDPDSFDSLRKSSHARAGIPLIASGYRFDDDQMVRQEDRDGTSSTLFFADENVNRQNNAFTVGLVWDLREAIFNPAEVQIYGLIGVQRDLMLEVTRTFYLRRQLILRLALRPPDEPLALAALRLRVDEFTAILDVLTGGWFSEEASQRRERRGLDKIVE